MSSRQRVLAALNHQQPDRTPIDFGGHRSSGIAAIAYARLREHLGLPRRPIRVYDPLQQLAIIDEDVLSRFGVDTIELGRGFALEDHHWIDWTLPDGTPCQMPVWARPERIDGAWILRAASGREMARMPDGAIYFEQTYYPFLENTPDLDHIPEALEEVMWAAAPSPPGPLGADPTALRDGARRLRASTDRAVIGLFGGNLFEMGCFLFRMDNFMLQMTLDQDLVQRFLARLVELHLANLERFLDAVGDSIDVILFGDDLGMHNGPLMAPEMYAAIFKPHHQRMWQRAKELANVRVMLHCCGGVRPLLPHLIEAGLDAINPVQTSCAGMDAAALKADFGDRLTFWGAGCDTNTILGTATPEAVAAHVRDRVRIMAPGGGFVFQQVHNVMANVPPANIVAMLDAARTPA